MASPRAGDQLVVASTLSFQFIELRGELLL